MRKLCNKAMGKKKGGVGGYVAAGILIIIVLAVGVTFREQIATFVTSFITNATQQAQTNFFTTEAITDLPKMMA